MLEHLEKTCPLEEWKKLRWGARVDLINGCVILVRFDIASAYGPKRVVFSPGCVDADFGHLIRMGRENKKGWDEEYWDICDAVADALNKKIGRMGMDFNAAGYHM